MKRYPNRTHYSRHFTRAELDCKCDRHGPGPRKHSRRIRRKLRRLALDLERMRRAYGKSLPVLSGYRCPAHNAEVGGASESQHMSATAADIKSSTRTQKALRAAAEKVPRFNRGGIGTYPSGALHVDRRPWYARWTSY